MVRAMNWSKQRGSAVGYVFALLGAAALISGAGFRLLNTSLSGSMQVNKALSNADLIHHVINTLASEATVDRDGLPLAPAGVVLVSGLTGSETPSGGWQIPATSKAAKLDAYGNQIAYCAWNHGSYASGTGYFQGSSANLASTYIAVISPGRDKAFQSNCTHAKTGVANGDDAVRYITLGAGQQIRNGAVAWLDPVECFNSTTPTQDVLGNAANCAASTSRVDLISTTGLSSGTMVLAKKAGYIYQLYGTTWHQIGGASGGYNSAGFAQASFSPVNGVNPSTVVESNSVQTSGIGSAILVTISGGAYAISSDNATWSAWQTAPGSISNSQYIKLRQTSSSSYSTTTTTTVNLGGVTRSWNVTTRAAITTPNAFSFTEVTGATANTAYTSNSVTITGIDIPVSLSSSGSAAGQTCNVNGAGWSTCSGTISSGSTLQVRQTSSGSPMTKTDMNVTVGGRSATFSVTTIDTPRFAVFGNGDFRGIAVDASGNSVFTGSIWEARSGDSLQGIYTISLGPALSSRWMTFIANNWEVDCCWRLRGLKVAMDSSGNSYALGSFSRGSYTLSVFSFNTGGGERWRRDIGASDGQLNPDTGAIAVSSNNNVYVVSGDWENTYGSSYGAVLVKYSSSGATQWKTRLNSAIAPQVIGRGIAIDASENIFIAGQAAGKTFVAKFNSSGSLLWQQTVDYTYGGGGDIGMAIGPSGDLYVGGGVSHSNGADAMILKINTNGTLLWQRRLGDGTGELYAPGVAVDSADNVYITGGPMLAKLNGAGSLQWMRTLPSSLGSAKAIAYRNGSLYIAHYYGISKVPADGSGTGTYGTLNYTGLSIAFVTTNYTVTPTNWSVVNPAIVTENFSFPFRLDTPVGNPCTVYPSGASCW